MSKKNKIPSPEHFMPQLEIMLLGKDISPDEKNDRQELARIANWIRLYGVPVERYRRNDGVICYRLAAETIREYRTSEESRAALMSRQRSIMAHASKCRRARAARDLFADLGILDQLPDVVRLLADSEQESDPIDTQPANAA